MKKYRYITISLNEPDTKKAEEIAAIQSRPLAQLLGLMISEQLNPNPRASIAESLTIYRDGEKVNELTATGTPAALELVKLFIWKRNNPRAVEIWQTINADGLHEVRGSYCFAGAGADYKYIYHFTGAACESFPTF